MDYTDFLVGSPMYRSVSDYGNGNVLRLIWQDLRGLNFAQGDWQRIEIEYSLLDGARFPVSSTLLKQGCWGLDDNLTLAYRHVVEADDFGIRPATIEFSKMIGHLPLAEAIPLWLPLLFSENDIVARNAFYYMALPSDLQMGGIPSVLASKFVWSLLANPALKIDVSQFIDQSAAISHDLLLEGLQQSFDRLRSKAIGEIRTGLNVAVAASNLETDFDIAPAISALVPLLTHEDEAISKLAFKLIRADYRNHILDQPTRDVISNALTLQIPLLKRSPFPFHQSLVGEIKELL